MAHQTSTPRPSRKRQMPIIMNGRVLMAAGCQIAMFLYRLQTHLSSLARGPGWKPVLSKQSGLHSAVTLSTNLCTPRREAWRVEQRRVGGAMEYPPTKIPSSFALTKYLSVSISLSSSLSSYASAFRSATRSQNASLPTSATMLGVTTISLTAISSLGRTFSSMIGQLLMRNLWSSLQLRQSSSLQRSYETRVHILIFLLDEVSFAPKLLPQVSWRESSPEWWSTMKSIFLRLSQARSLISIVVNPELSLLSSYSTFSVLSYRFTEKIRIPSEPYATAKQLPSSAIAPQKFFRFSQRDTAEKESLTREKITAWLWLMKMPEPLVQLSGRITKLPFAMLAQAVLWVVCYLIDEKSEGTVLTFTYPSSNMQQSLPLKRAMSMRLRGYWILAKSQTSPQGALLPEMLLNELPQKFVSGGSYWQGGKSTSLPSTTSCTSLRQTRLSLPKGEKTASMREL